MRYKGRITDWKDDRGFGFITPSLGGAKVFVHIKSFSNRQRRPVGNELVTYEMTTDGKSRSQGVKVAFVDDIPTARKETLPGPGIVVFLEDRSCPLAEIHSGIKCVNCCRKL